MSLPLGALQMAEMFEGLPRVMFCLKAPDGRYLMVNQAFADRACCKTSARVIGRTAAELFAPELAVSYAAQDAALLMGGPPVRRQLELINRPDGTLGWYVTNKTVLRDADGTPVAIAGVSVDAELPAGRIGVSGIEAALTLVRAEYAKPLTASDLAGAAGMQTTQLERRMRRLLGLSPRQLIVRVRVEQAVHRIVRSRQPLAQIAADCGFSDQAAMSRQVKELLGVPPSALRAAQKEAVNETAPHQPPGW